MRWFYAFLIIGIKSQQRICRANLDKSTCLVHSGDRGTRYRGSLNVTRTGAPCKTWEKYKSVQSTILFTDENGETVKRPGNHCRNGGYKGRRLVVPKRARPWCPVDKSINRAGWEYCEVPKCNEKAYNRKCNLEKQFGVRQLFEFKFNYNRESCIITEQYPNFLDEWKIDHVNSPWEDCGLSFKGTISKATVLSRNTTHTCRRWDDKSDPVIRYDPGERQNYCSLPDYQYGMECTTEQQPWCYIEGGDEVNKYGVCHIPKCQCGSTGLTYTDPLDNESKVPDDLSFLKSDSHADKFIDIIDNWNSNTPDDSKSADVCEYWKKRNDKTRKRRDTDFYNHEDYEDEQDSDDSDESGIIDETEEVETIKPAAVLMRIINGAKYVPGMTPWLVALDDTKNRKGCNWSHFCGGTLIHPQWVVTAAHCIQAQHIRNPRTIEVIAGMNDIDGDLYAQDSTTCGGQIVAAKKIIKHKQYGRNFVNDIALIMLEEPFWINNMVNYLCLPPPTYRPPNGQVCMISGWGLHSGVDGPGGEIRTDENRKKFIDSKVGLVRHYEKADCECALYQAKWDSNPATAKNTTILDSQLCFGYKTVDTCSGDSGGPLVCKAPDDVDAPYYLTGIVSYGITTTRMIKGKDGETKTIDLKCGKKNVPGIYTNVASYTQWIYESMYKHTANIQE